MNKICGCYDINDEIAFFAKKLGMRVSELERIICSCEWGGSYTNDLGEDVDVEFYLESGFTTLTWEEEEVM